MKIDTIIELLSDYDYELNDVYNTIFFLREMVSRLEYSVSTRDYGYQFEIPDFLQKGE